LLFLLATCTRERKDVEQLDDRAFFQVIPIPLQFVEPLLDSNPVK